VHLAEPGWENSLRTLYADRRSGAVPRPPRTLVQQIQTIKNITANNTRNVAVSKNINLTHVQNVTALAPLKEVNNLKITHLGAITPGKETKVAPHVMKLEGVPKEERIGAQKAATQLHNLGVERQASEAKLLVQGGNPVKHTDPPRTVKLEVPRAPVEAPRFAPRVAPPAPTIPAHVEHAIPKYEPRPPPGPPKKENKK
jgi:hypothetical protein